MKHILLFVLVLISITSKANNIAVANATLSTQNTTAHTEIINFDVSWENSWRTSTNENNYDGAWIFVKFRKQGTNDWRHCTINGTGFTAGTGATFSIPTDFYELSKSIFTFFLSCRNAVINKGLSILHNSKGT